jgi:hypothetical protein
MRAGCGVAFSANEGTSALVFPQSSRGVLSPCGEPLVALGARLGIPRRLGDIELPKVRDAFEFALTSIREREAASGDRSFTVRETTTSRGPAVPRRRAAIVTARPPGLPSMTSHSPMCTPARVSIPRLATLAAISCAQWIARAGTTKLA